MAESPGSCSVCNIPVLAMNGMSSLLELEDCLFTGTHVSTSALDALFIVNQKIPSGLCIEEGEPTSQIDILRVWYGSH